MCIGLVDAVRAVVIDRCGHAHVERRVDAPVEILLGLRGVEQDGGDVVGVARPNLDFLVKLDPEGGDRRIEQLFDGEVLA